MEYYPCRNVLSFLFNLHDRILFVTMRHDHHDTYRNTTMSPEILEFIDANVRLTPSELYARIDEDELPGHDRILPAQVYYQ